MPAGGSFGAGPGADPGASGGFDPAAIDPAKLPKGFDKFLGK